MVDLASGGYRARASTRSGGKASRLRVEEMGDCLVVSSGPDSHRASMVARSLPGEAGRVSVIMPYAFTPRMAELARRLWHWVPVEWESVRLVTAYAASPNGSDRPPAQELAEMLGVEVVAPDGRLLVVPGGSIFVTDRPDGKGDGGWWRFRPGRAPEAAGRRFPTPDWEADLAGFADPGIAGVQIEEIPAGLWVHWASKAHSTDLAYAVPAHPSAVALLVSRPGDRPLRSGDVQRLVEALPEVVLHDRLTVIPYGDQPVADGRLGAVVSLAANRTLPVRTGLPLYLPDGTHRVVAVARNGRPTWSPFARGMAWRPHGGARILNWTLPANNLLPVGPGQLLLNERWLVEIIEAGLWVRGVDSLEGAAVVRQLPLRSRYCTVVVGVFDTDQAPPPWRAIGKLLQQLPVDAQARLRLVVPQVAGEKMFDAAVKACRRAVSRAVVYALTPNGRLAQYSEPGGRPSRSEQQSRYTEPARELPVESADMGRSEAEVPVARRPSFGGPGERRDPSPSRIEEPRPTPGRRQGRRPSPADPSAVRPSVEPDVASSDPPPPEPSTSSVLVPDRIISDRRDDESPRTVDRVEDSVSPDHGRGDPEFVSGGGRPGSSGFPGRSTARSTLRPDLEETAWEDEESSWDEGAEDERRSATWIKFGPNQ